MSEGISNPNEVLADVAATIARARRAVAAETLGPLLMIWGMVWIGGFLCTQFFPGSSERIWISLDLLGILATGAAAGFNRRRHAVRSINEMAEKKRMFWFWILWCGYVALLKFFIGPIDEMRAAAFMVVCVAFAYVVIGIWLPSGVFLLLGLVIAAMAMIGFQLMHPWFLVWMAATGGISVVGAGAYIQMRWRVAGA